MAVAEGGPFGGFAAERAPLGVADGWRTEAEAALAEQGQPLRPPAIVAISLAEQQSIEARFGRGGIDALLSQVAFHIEPELALHERIGRSGRGTLLLLLRDTLTTQIPRRLERIVGVLTRSPLTIGEERLHVTPVTGWAAAGPSLQDAAPTVDLLLGRALAAAELAARQGDLVPRRWTHDTPRRRRLVPPAIVRTALQILGSLAIGVLLPFLLLVQLHRFGIELAPLLYLTVVISLFVSSFVAWIEGLASLRTAGAPARPARDYPAASAIIAAYLPNEAATIMETIEAFLAVDYPGSLQIVLAYNTPVDLPVEAELEALARRDGRFHPIRVEHSTSKAQNVNAALQVVSGEFTGVFDADHHPDVTSFRRAWRWISHGADVVQGHCLIRNGAASWVARMVAVEFEAIYAVSHPGRAKLHDFGLFCGSNGFWRTSLLHEVRMRGDMMTEDIDSSMRVLLRGRRVVTDRRLLSRELAPATVRALWNQRMRWAQGWFQVARRHLGKALLSDELTVRNKLGLLFLLGWREICPWLSLQTIPVIAYLAWRHGLGAIELGIPIFVLSTIWSLSAGPLQVFLAYQLGALEMRRHPTWFLGYLALSLAGYQEFKNAVARVAQIKELCGERRWVVTPRNRA